MARVCEFCKGPVVGRQANARYCSQRCVRSAWRVRNPEVDAAGRSAANHRRSAEHAAVRDADRTCEGCGGSMAGKRASARFCSTPCRARHQYRQRPEIKAKLEAERLCKTCHEPLPGHLMLNAIYCSAECRRRGWAADNPAKIAQARANQAERLRDQTALRRLERPPCPVCGKPLPADRGPKAIYCSDSCNQKAHYRRHHVHHLARMRKYRKGREPYFARKARENTAARLASDPDFIFVRRARARVDYQKYRPRRLEVNRQYARSHKALRSVHSSKRRALKKGAETFLFTLKDWERLKTRYRHCCAYCGVYSEELHQEHVIPLERGGRHSLGNILPSCPTCNYSKQDSYVMEWRMRLIRVDRELKLREARALDRDAAGSLSG